MFERLRAHRERVEEFLGSLVQRAGGDPVTNDADRPDEEGPAVDRPEAAVPDVLSQAAEVVAAAEGLTCSVCEDPIEPGSDTVEAAYGTVHAEPCSHQGKAL